MSINKNWKFILDDSEDYCKKDICTESWQTVNIPHDWSIAYKFDKEKGEGCTAYLPGGIGWYRKDFCLDFDCDTQKLFICFDGVYNYTDVYINGSFVGSHDYGYSPFYFDISDYVEKHNTIAVRVDHSRYADSRWYTGSGIYREVELFKMKKLYIPIWGINSEAIVEGEDGIVDCEIEICNELGLNKRYSIEQSLLYQDEEVSSYNADYICDGKSEISTKMNVNNIKLWDTDNPNLYTLQTELIVDGEIVQRFESFIGFRTIVFDKDKGLFVNGKVAAIKGVCLHHDAGLVGAAVPKDVHKRRLNILKEMGCNAIRTAHNPPSKEFLDICDEMGFLVQVEFFDEWDNQKDKRFNKNDVSCDYITKSNAKPFRRWAQKELKAVMKRDRNHACVFQWSIGNEIEWTYRKNKEATGFFDANTTGNYFWEQPPNSKEKIREIYESMPKNKYEIGDTAKLLAGWTREMDKTRPVTANCILPSVSFESGFCDVLDVVGFSYRRVMYDYAHINYDKPIYGAENLGQWHEWKAVLEREHIAGIFIWTGIEYLGEANDKWPVKCVDSGLVDFAGFEKPPYHMFKSLWNDKPNIHVVSQTLEKSIYTLNDDGEIVEKEQGAWEKRLWNWHDVTRAWEYDEKEIVIVEVYTNCEHVELMLNGKSYGIKYLENFCDHVIKYCVPYQKGELQVCGVKDNEKASDSLYSTGELAVIDIKSDKNILHANNKDVTHITLTLKDEKLHQIIDKDCEVCFEVEGKYRLLGVDNGAKDSVQNYMSKSVVTNNGMCLLAIQATNKKSKICIKAHAKGLVSNTEVILVT